MPEGFFLLTFEWFLTTTRKIEKPARSVAGGLVAIVYVHAVRVDWGKDEKL